MNDFTYDIALSFAEEQRDAANSLKLALHTVGLENIYYYPDYTDKGWGKDLANELAHLYEYEARYALVFLSKEYFRKKYTNIEYDAMLRRKEQDAPLVYMLPVMMCEVKKLGRPELEELHFIKWTSNPEEVAATLKKLLGKDRRDIHTKEEFRAYRYLFANDNYDKVVTAIHKILRPVVWPLMAGIAGVLAIGAYGISTICLSYPSKKVQLPAGTYTMGSSGTQAGMLPHTVLLNAFSIWSTEITFREYRQYCDSTGAKMPPPPPYPYTEDYPVVNITWQDATAYCAWRGGRLPTEAEWEYAAAQNGKPTDRYSGGNNMSRIGYYETNADGKAHPVAKKCGGKLGLHDMSGNVAEWCADWYAPYADSLQHNPLAADSSSQRKVVRGGHYGSHVKPNATDNQLRITFRDSERPDSARTYIGFRVVWDE